MKIKTVFFTPRHSNLPKRIIRAKGKPEIFGAIEDVIAFHSANTLGREEFRSVKMHGF